MAEEKQNKIVLEREYIVPLRMGWLKVPEYKRANKAVKTLKEFIVKHMKVYDRDLRKARVDVLLNNEIRFRGMRHPPSQIKVKAIKYEDGFVDVKLVNIPVHIEFELARKARIAVEKAQAQAGVKPEVKPVVEEKKKETVETKEKEESSKIAQEATEKADAKKAKHTSKTSQEAPKERRKDLKK